MARRSHAQVVTDTTKEFVNLRRTLMSMEKKGATLSDEQRAIVNMKPSEFKRGEINAKVERQLLGIRKRIPQDASYTDPETGRTISWGEHQKERRSAAARQGARTRKRMKEVMLNIKYIDIVDGYMEDVVERAGSGLRDLVQVRTARINIQGPYQSWKLIMSEALQSEESYKALNNALIAVEPKVKEAVDIIINDSNAETVQYQTWKLGNSIRALKAAYSALSTEESQNMRGGGWYEQTVELPY